MKNKLLTLLVFFFLTGTANIEACTIFSGKDKKGHVWAGNNEDFYFTFNSYLNLVASTDTTFGYMYLTYFSPDNYIQGGTNEAGLFFNGSTTYPSEYKNYGMMKEFPGGSKQLLHYILKKCKTVPEVLSLFRKYRLNGLEAAQLHFADKYGNLGIIVSDSMWITKSDYQVSTNYNLCHPNKDGINCWRFPIAESILGSKEPGYETFRMICDSTSRKTRYVTVYSNIHNLNTGEIWFFFGMDYINSYHTNLKSLLENGSRSFFISELFDEQPIVKTYNTYHSSGYAGSLKVLDSYAISPERKTEIMRLFTQDLILFNRDFNSYGFLESYMKTQKTPDEFNVTLNAIALFCLNRKNEAVDILQKYVSEKPNSVTAKEILNQMQGIAPAGANARFELKGYASAKNVFVDGISISPIYNFLTRDGDKWIGNFKLPMNEYLYYFTVDGEKVLDPSNTDIVKDGNNEFNKLIINPN
jgi:hypothetical protein